MKTVFVFLLSVCLTGTAMAQLSFSVQAISIEDVPQAVQTTQSGNFPGITVAQWEKQTASTQGESGTRYVANFKDGGNQVVRARYYTNGTGVTATTYYAASQLPSVIKDAAARNYPDYKLTSGEKIFLLSTQKSYYRIRLRKGAQKLVVYVNNNGEEIQRKNIPSQVREDEVAE